MSRKISKNINTKVIPFVILFMLLLISFPNIVLQVRADAPKGSDTFSVGTSGTIDPGNATCTWMGRGKVVEYSNATSTYWILVYRAGTTHSTDANACHCIRFSDDNGATWTNRYTFLNGSSVIGFPVCTPPPTDTSDCGIEVLDNGKIIFSYNNRDTTTTMRSGGFMISEDGGYSWTVLCDKYWFTGADSWFNNRTVFGQPIHEWNGVLYMSAWFKGLGWYGSGFYPGLIKSTDNGSNWQVIGNMSNGVSVDLNEYDVGFYNFLGVEGAVCVARDTDCSGTHQSHSDDGGNWAIWDNFVVKSSLGTLQRPMICTFDDEPNRLYMTGRKGSSNPVYYSDDLGETWTLGCSYSAGGETGYNDIVKIDNDTLYVVTYSGSYPSPADLKYFHVDISRGFKPTPYNGSTITDSSITLSTEVHDPDGDTMDVSFYSESGYLIGTDSGVLNGNVASVSWSSASAGDNTWYAIANDGSLQTESAHWSFHWSPSGDITLEFTSINSQENDTVLQDQHRYFIWTRDVSTTAYQIRTANDSIFTDIFLNLNNITVSNGYCTNTFLNTSNSASPYAYNYWENSTHCFFYLPYAYNITGYKYHYYQVRSYT